MKRRTNQSPGLLTKKVFQRHRANVRKLVKSRSMSMLVHELLRRLWPHEVGETIPAGLVQFLRISLRPDLIDLVKPEYFMRPLEHMEIRGLVIEFIIIWAPSDAELDLLATKMAPHAAEFSRDIHAAIERTMADKYMMPDTGMDRVDVRKRLLELLGHVTTKAICLRAAQPKN
jgi:hypothetical protein